jgi:hypothetical protein
MNKQEKALVEVQQLIADLRETIFEATKPDAEKIKPVAGVGAKVMAWNSNRANAVFGIVTEVTDAGYKVNYRNFNSRRGVWMNLTTNFQNVELVVG